MPAQHTDFSVGCGVLCLADVTSREEQIDAIAGTLGERELIWFGIRGEDAAAYLALPQFTSSFSITAPLQAAKLATSESLEESTGIRVDLDVYDVDLDPSQSVLALRRRLLTSSNRLSAITTYRPSHFLSAVHFASLERTEYLGLFKDCQTAFEHKPWVEYELRRVGIRTLPWRYFADESRDQIKLAVQHRPQVLRASRSSGGEGMELISSPAAVDEKWPFREDHLVSVTEFLPDTVPVNVGAVTFLDGTVAVHPASIQLIGIPLCTSRRFGYCGNDFGVFRLLSHRQLREIDDMTRRSGRWLASRGYVGAFGADYLVDGDDVYLTEINPRMQGSTALSAELAERIDHPGILLDHLAAFLRLEPGPSLTITDWASEIPVAGQVVVHNTGGSGIGRQPLSLPAWPSERLRLELLPAHQIVVLPGAVLFRLVHEGPVTATGYDVASLLERRIEEVLRLFGGTAR
jgi:hypothetical protein